MFTGAMVATSQSGVSSYETQERQGEANGGAIKAGMVLLVLAQGVYGLTIATAVWTYPSEILSTRQRTSAMSPHNMTVVVEGDSAG